MSRVEQASFSPATVVGGVCFSRSYGACLSQATNRKSYRRLSHNAFARKHTHSLPIGERTRKRSLTRNFIRGAPRTDPTSTTHLIVEESVVLRYRELQVAGHLRSGHGRHKPVDGETSVKRVMSANATRCTWIVCEKKTAFGQIRLAGVTCLHANCCAGTPRIWLYTCTNESQQQATNRARVQYHGVRC